MVIFRKNASKHKWIPATQSIVEQRSMFTMWAALPGPLILSADLRPGTGGLDDDVLASSKSRLLS